MMSSPIFLIALGTLAAAIPYSSSSSALAFTERATPPNSTPSSSDASNSSSSTSSNLGVSYQATITGYQDCGTAQGSCGFVASPGAFTGAVSVYWNTPGLPGQCGTCWQIHDASNVDTSTNSRGAPITTPPITVIITNTCAPDLSKPGFQCNQQASAPQDKFGSVTVVDLCVDTGAPAALWGEDGKNGGLALATITQVDCENWQGTVGPFADWSAFQAKPDGKGVVPKSGAARV